MCFLRKKDILCVVSMFLVFTLSGCAAKDSKNSSKKSSTDVFEIAMVTDLSGINDQSFNQSAWEGLKELKNELNSKVEISYSEPKQSSDYNLILDKLSDKKYNLIYGISFSLSDAIYKAAQLNPDKTYAIVDSTYKEKTPKNVVCITFCVEQSAFLVGYIAGLTTKTNKVGFVGGMKSEIIDQFEYGFKAGVNFASKTLNKNIDVTVQYAESFSDVAKGKAIGSKLYNSGCDIIFQAAGGTGYGVIESAKENNKFVIGVDRDQSDLAPKNVLTSALKNVNKAIYLVSKKIIEEGKDILGTTLTFGSKEGCVGIPENYNLMGKETYDLAINLSKTISDGKVTIDNKILTIPYNEESYNIYIDSLNLSGGK